MFFYANFLNKMRSVCVCVFFCNFHFQIFFFLWIRSCFFVFFPEHFCSVMRLWCWRYFPFLFIFTHSSTMMNRFSLCRWLSTLLMSSFVVSITIDFRHVSNKFSNSHFGSRIGIWYRIGKLMVSAKHTLQCPNIWIFVLIPFHKPKIGRFVFMLFVPAFFALPKRKPGNIRWVLWMEFNLLAKCINWNLLSVIIFIK